MHHEERVDGGHGGVEAGPVQRRELRHAGVDEEALEAEHPGLVQRRQLALVARHRSAPEPDVDVALPPRGGPLKLK